MATAQDIIDDIKADLTLEGSEYDTQLLRAIQSSLRQLRGKRYWFLKGYGSLTCTASSSSLTITSSISNFSVLDTAELVDSGVRYTQGEGFDFLSFNDLRAQHWTIDPLNTGRPTAYAVEDTTMYFSHLCGDTYTVYLTYYKQDATLPSAAGTSLWFDDGYDVIRAMAQYNFKRDAQGMTPKEADADMVSLAISNLDRTHEAKVSGRY